MQPGMNSYRMNLGRHFSNITQGHSLECPFMPISRLWTLKILMNVLDKQVHDHETNIFKEGFP